MIDQLKQTVLAVLEKLAELKREIAAAKAAPPAEPTELVAANERAASAEARVKELEYNLAQLQAQDDAEETAISQVLDQLSTALTE